MSVYPLSLSTTLVFFWQRRKVQQRASAAVASFINLRAASSFVARGRFCTAHACASLGLLLHLRTFPTLAHCKAPPYSPGLAPITTRTPIIATFISNLRCAAYLSISMPAGVCLHISSPRLAAASRYRYLHGFDSISDKLPRLVSVRFHWLHYRPGNRYANVFRFFGVSALDTGVTLKKNVSAQIPKGTLLLRVLNTVLVKNNPSH